MSSTFDARNLASGKPPLMRVAIDADDAREGVTGHHVRYVLGVSLALTVVAFLALFAFGIG